MGFCGTIPATFQKLLKHSGDCGSDGAGINLAWGKCPCSWQGLDSTRDELQGPFQPQTIVGTALSVTGWAWTSPHLLHIQLPAEQNPWGDFHEFQGVVPPSLPILLGRKGSTSSCRAPCNGNFPFRSRGRCEGFYSEPENSN